MKNVFGYPRNDNGAAVCDGERFVTERVDPAFKSEIDSSKKHIEDVKKKGRMPTKDVFIFGGLGMAFPLGLIWIYTHCDTFDPAVVLAEQPVAFIIALLGFLIESAFLLVSIAKNKKVNSSPELKEANARLASLDKNSEIMLGVPQEYEKVDVLSFEYVEKNGKVKIPDTQSYRYLNNAMKLYKNGDMLCLADIERVYSLPIADVKKYVLKKRKALMSGWNKETAYNEGRYIKYRLSKNDNGSINSKYCAMRCADSFGEYEVFFPEYELEAFKAIADAPTEKE